MCLFSRVLALGQAEKMRAKEAAENHASEVDLVQNIEAPSPAGRTTETSADMVRSLPPPLPNANADPWLNTRRR